MNQQSVADGAHAAFVPLKPHRDKLPSLNPAVAVIAGCATLGLAVWGVAPAMSAIFTLEGRAQSLVVGISVMVIWTAVDILGGRFQSRLSGWLRFLDPYVGHKLRATIEALSARK